VIRYNNIDILCENSDEIELLEKSRRPNNLRHISSLPRYRVLKQCNEYGRRVWECILPQLLNEVPLTIAEKLENKNSKPNKKPHKKIFHERYT
jgi:hypothetical protein